MTAKEILAKIKAVFVDEQTPPAPPVPPVIEPKVYKLADGTEVMITQAGDVPAVGDTVTVGGVPPAAGDLQLEDKSFITVDAAGVITAIKPAEPVTTDLGQNPVVVTPTVPAPTVQMSSEKTIEDIRIMCTAFASGTPEERLTNLEIVAKALMENCLGYQLNEAERKAATEQAIQVYKQDLTAAQESVATAQAKMAKHEETIKGLFELVEKLVEMPATDPKTLTGNKKEQFNRTEARERKLEGIANAIKEMKKRQ